ncbi:hypothetical protein MTP99_013222 [Tenebrio molitor]|nr:hypothetical protein MTP99_013222 [Tenebrio molitor]
MKKATQEQIPSEPVLCPFTEWIIESNKKNPAPHDLSDSSPAIEMGSESNTITPIRCQMTSSAAVRREECAPAKKNPWD